MTKPPFSKPPIVLQAQVELLESRGMQVSDQALARELLLRTNYYRFSGYALHFEEPGDGVRTHRYVPGTTLEQVAELMAFDVRLRSLLGRHLATIEVAFRSVFCYEMCVGTGDPHWYLAPATYRAPFRYEDQRAAWERAYAQADEVFCAAYRSNYTSPPLPPAWMMTEIVPFGCWSLMYSFVADSALRKATSTHFRALPYYLESWIHCVSVLRNLCAHHSRIWDRQFMVKPRLDRPDSAALRTNARLAAQVLVVGKLLAPLGQLAAFQSEWTALMADFSRVDRYPMGMTSVDLGPLWQAHG